MTVRIDAQPNFPGPDMSTAEQLLADTVTAVTEAGDIACSVLVGGDPAALREALYRLQDALGYLAYLESWDIPPNPGAYTLWELMARRHLPNQGELFAEDYVPNAEVAAARESGACLYQMDGGPA